MDTVARIAKKIKDNGWSESEFARRLGKNQSIMRDWRRGSSSPEKHIEYIARVLGTTSAYLHGETDDPASIPSLSNIILDDLEFALFGEVRELTAADKAELLRNARRMRELQELRKLHRTE